MRNDSQRLAEEMTARGPYKGWEFEYLDQPGSFSYWHPASPVRVYFTPDWSAGDEITVQTERDDDEPEIDDGAAIPFPIRTADRLFEAVRPWLDKYQPLKRLGVWQRK